MHSLCSVSILCFLLNYFELDFTIVVWFQQIDCNFVPLISLDFDEMICFSPFRTLLWRPTLDHNKVRVDTWTDVGSIEKRFSFKLKLSASSPTRAFP